MAQGVGELWDALVESARQQASTTSAATTTGCSRLRLKTGAEGDEVVPVALPTIQRSIALIDPRLRSAIRCCVSGTAPWPLFVYGPAGTGKTCAALALLDCVAGRRGLYIVADEWCDRLIEASKGRVSERCEGGSVTLTPFHLWQRLEDAPLVVLDEVACRERVGDWHYRVVKDVIDRRTGKPLVVLSNVSLQKIEQSYDDRISSRLAAGTVLQLTGPDRRLLSASCGAD